MGFIQKPLLSDRIDPFHPLSKNLVFAPFMLDRGGLTVTDTSLYRQDGLISGSGVSWGPEGLDFDITTDYVNHGLLNMGGLDEFTVILKYTMRSDRGTIYPFANYSDTEAGFAIRISADQSRCRLVTTSGQEDTTLHTFTSIGTYVLAYTYYKGDTNGYLNGVHTTQDTLGTSLDPDDSSNNLRLGTPARYTHLDTDGIIHYAFVYFRALSPQEIASLYVDPYQMIYKPKPIYLTPDAGEPSSIPVAMHHYTKNIGP